MIRVALAVLLALALAGATLPAVDTARDERAADAARLAADDLGEAMAALASTSDPTPPDVPGASATVIVSFPPSAGDRLDALVIGSVGEDGGPAVASRLAGGERRVHSLPTPVRTPETGASPLVLRESTTLWLTYDRTERGTAVAVARVPDV